MKETSSTVESYAPIVSHGAIVEVDAAANDVAHNPVVAIRPRCFVPRAFAMTIIGIRICPTEGSAKVNEKGECGYAVLHGAV